MGVSAGGCLARGCLARAGSAQGRCLPRAGSAKPLPHEQNQTPVKTKPCRNYVADSKNPRSGFAPMTHN